MSLSWALVLVDSALIRWSSDIENVSQSDPTV